ncbi:MAG: SDR family oxidoreductase [Anaerolineales bacterium]
MSKQHQVMENFDLTGKVAIVTGGAGFLGRSHALTLASAGARVVVADIREQAARDVAEEVQSATGGKCSPRLTDVRDIASVRSMVGATRDQFGRIDILVNNAALDPKFDPEHAGEHATAFEDFPLTAWRKAMDVEVTGMFLCAQAVARPMLKARSGVIVNISSTYGMVGPDQRIYQREGEPKRYKPVTYSVNKAAVLGFTRYLATYFRGKGIRVNSLTAGGVFAGHDREFERKYSEKTTLDRMAKKEEISSALLFLVSDASSYMTGANLVVDGGWTAW